MVKHKGAKKALNAKGKKGGAAFMQKGNKPPQMGGPLPAQHQGNMPPWMRERFPDATWGPEGNMSPWMRGPGYDGRCELGEPMPPWRRGPFLGERCGGSMPPEMRGPFPGDRCGGSMPPEMRGPFSGERCGGSMPPEMRGPFSRERCGGSRPPQMRGPFPEEMGECRGSVPPQMRGPFPEEMGECRGNMAPQMRGPCSDAMFEQRGNVPPQIRGPFPGEMCEPNRNVPSQMNRPNSSDPWPCGPLPGEDDIRRPAPFPVIKQKEVGGSAPVHLEKDSFASGNHSSNQLASAKVGKPTTNVQERYIQEGAERILESFGLSHEDLEELSSYPEDQLKPENMPEILRTIRMRKLAQQIPPRDTVGGDGLYSPLTGPMGTVQPSTPFMGASVSQPTKLPSSPESLKMNKCPTPSMMNDYYGTFPRVFPHTCILCKIECKHSVGWLLHLNTTTHSESCHQLRQQYPDWNSEDASFRKRYESDRNANQVPRQPFVSSSPEHSRVQSRSRSRSPGHGRASRQRSRSPISPRMSPTDSRTSRQSAAQYVAAEQPHIQSEHHGKLSKDLVQEEQPKVEAANQEQLKTDPQPLVLSSLVEKSVSQAMSLLQPEGTGSGSLIQGVGLPTLPPVQLDPTSVSLGLVSMMQMVATQVVQAVLAAKEGLSGQAMASAAPSSAVASVTPQPASSVSSNVEKQGNKQEVVPRIVSPHADSRLWPVRHRVLICGHSIIYQAEQQARNGEFGSHLGLGDLAVVEWLSKNDLRWHDLMPMLFVERQGPPLQILVIHLGATDMGLVKGKALVIQAIQDMEAIQSSWPGVSIVWSAMLPRKVWQGNADPRRLHIARRRVNREIQNALAKGLGHFLPHPQIVLNRPELYDADGVHLSEEGNQIFLGDLQQGVKAVLDSLLGE